MCAHCVCSKITYLLQAELQHKTPILPHLALHRGDAIIVDGGDGAEGDDRTSNVVKTGKEDRSMDRQGALAGSTGIPLRTTKRRESAVMCRPESADGTTSVSSFGQNQVLLSF